LRLGLDVRQERPRTEAQASLVTPHSAAQSAG